MMPKINMKKPMHIFSTVFPFGSGWLENRIVVQTKDGLASFLEVGARKSQSRFQYDFKKHKTIEEILSL